MPENNKDQAGQGNLNDQNNKRGQTTENTSGQTNNPSNLNPPNEGKKGYDESTETGKNAGIQNQGNTASSKQTGTNVSNIQDSDEEEIKEIEDLDHPHRVDTPRAEEKSAVLGENTIEGENQGSDRITNTPEDKAL